MDFHSLSMYARMEEYLRTAKPRELVWFRRSCKLIDEKFHGKLPYIRVLFFKRNPKGTGQNCCSTLGRFHGIGKCPMSSYIELHKKYGTTRSTLLHELVHYYIYYNNKPRGHTKEFWTTLERLKYRKLKE